ncbi:ribbon-helix-helix protein, CopG family [Schlesneria paludicola]|uniref:ribbon-helix-helix protein, CopG family n=1 Tax=Schlesneria paludicola TaxID=360056 RepID=UPI00029B060E|nr:ribbon-helix-helix protein, CopG family [Schlesneria paludicola]
MSHYRKASGFVHRVTVEIPLKEFKRLEQRARAEGKSISQCAYEQLGPWLKTLPTQPPAEAA